MCPRREGVRALCEAAHGLTQACLDELLPNGALLSNADTLAFLPAAPPDFEALLRRVDAVAPTDAASAALTNH